MNLLGFSLLLISLCMVVFTPRHIALLGMMFAAIYIPFEQHVVVFGANMYAMRFVELAGCFRVFSRGEFSLSKLNAFDKLFLSLFTYTLVIFLIRSNEDLAYKTATTLDAYCCYFIFKGLVQGTEDLKEFLPRFIIILAPFVVPLMIETLTGNNPFSAMGKHDPPEYQRHGRQRAFGSFGHPSLVGTLGASFVPLYIAYGFEKAKRFKAALGIIVCILIIWASDSGAPLSCLMFGVLGWMFWRIRTKMQTVRRAIVAAIVFIQLFSKSSIWYLPSHLSDLTGGDGYYRSNLMDVAYQNIGKWAFVGMSLQETANWFPTKLASGVADVTNEYFSYGFTAGLVAMVLFVMIFVKGFSRLGRAMEAIRAARGTPTEAEIFLWGLGVMLFIHASNFISIRYYDQTYVIWYMQLAVISTLTELGLKDPAGQTPTITDVPMAETGLEQPTDRLSTYPFPDNRGALS